MGARMAHRSSGKYARAGGNRIPEPRSSNDGTRTGSGLSHARISNGIHASGGVLAFPHPSDRPAIERPARERPIGERAEQAAPLPAAPEGDVAETEFKACSNAELLQLFAQSRDEQAFAELYYRHKSEIYTYCVRMMSGDRDKASDIFQEVFIRVFERAEQFRIGSNVAGWLYTIARNQCLNTHRNQHSSERLDSADSSLRDAGFDRPKSCAGV